jgi:hypothetical protein
MSEVGGTSKRQGLVFGAIAALATTAIAVSGFVVGCGSENTVVDSVADSGADVTTAPVDDDGGPGLVLEDAGPPTVTPDECADASADAGPVDCTGKCGPVKDKCTGKVTQCGGCQDVSGEKRVCDLLTNTCIKPKTTCAELGAECGTTKDSCGNYLDCPDGNTKGCPAGKECDPDTKKCKDATAVTCQDLGKECGFAWLGAGPDTNLTDCGACAGGKVCNQGFNVCEPNCTPKTAKELCDAAKAKTGVQCGIISNGCGGTVSCDNVAGYGCKTGESCGVRGIANRCDTFQTPDECKAAGRNCGSITSACTGKQVKCGECANGQVCNANGVCGAPCAPKTCTDFAAFECGTFDDSCGGKVTCGTCANGVCDLATNKCCTTNKCDGALYTGKCGSGLANGCGQTNVACPCATGICTQNGGATPAPASGVTGQCCTPKTTKQFQDAGQCGRKLATGCGTTVDVGCGGNQECVDNLTGAPGKPPADGVIGSCCTRTDSCASNVAPSCAPVANSCRTDGQNARDCSGTCTGGKQCANNVCCTGAPACTGSRSDGGECNVTKQPTDASCGSARSCGCSNGSSCMCGGAPCANAAAGPGICKPSLTCSSPAYNGKCGTALDNATGGTINCGCPNGQVCSTSAAGATGTCECNNPTKAPYTCANVPNGPGQVGGDACGSFSNGCGGTLTCNCAQQGDVCNTVANPNVCCAPSACPAQALGSACGSLSNGCGGTKNCGCPGGAGFENFTCTANTCQCVKDTCRGRTGPQPDRCGGTLPCGG